MAGARGAAVALLLEAALAFDFVDMLPKMPDLETLEHKAAEHLPDMSLGGMSIEVTQAGDTAVVNPCTYQELTAEPSGWPAQLDWGVYWVGPNGDRKRAKVAQRVSPTQPLSWYEHGDGYPNRTARYQAEYFDPTQKTLIFFHGGAGSDSFFPQQCRRVDTFCDGTICPDAKDGRINFASKWIEDGWNIGFFYWDQFANEPCSRDAEQKIWFDRIGTGLKWASYQPNNHSVVHPSYLGEDISIAQMCERAVKDAVGDFYSGQTVRFVGYGIGAQLAAACASRLHGVGHIAAPQRVSLIDPFWTGRETYWMGVSVRCGQLTTTDGIDGFVQEATVGAIKGLWLKNKVVTEVYTTSKGSNMGMDDAAVNTDLENHALVVVQDLDFCKKSPDKACRHKAILPMYFLGYSEQAPLLRDDRNRSAVPPGSCHVPSAGCTDAQLRAMMAWKIEVMQRTQSKARTEDVWTQLTGGETMDISDDFYVYTQESSPRSRADIERSVLASLPMRKRRWDMSRAIQMWPQAGMSLPQLRTVLGVSLGLFVLPCLLYFAFCAVCCLVRRFRSSDVERLESDEEADPTSAHGDE